MRSIIVFINEEIIIWVIWSVSCVNCNNFVTYVTVIDNYEPYMPTNVDLKGDCGEKALERTQSINKFGLKLKYILNVHRKRNFSSILG